MENLTVYSTNGNLIQHSKPIVTVETEVEIAGQGELPITIIADFTDIPEHKHEMFLQAFKMMYNIKF
jgi:hypothetical protein